jgi:sulfite reductase (NADPH) hemoprotein beta-component
MYIYDDIDQRMVDERVAQFRDQTRRFLEGKLERTISARCGLRNGSTSSATRRCCASQFLMVF